MRIPKFFLMLSFFLALFGCKEIKYAIYGYEETDHDKIFFTIFPYIHLDPDEDSVKAYHTAIKLLDSLQCDLADSVKDDIYYYKAVFYQRLGTFEDAIENINLSLKFGPNDYYKWFEKGLIYENIQIKGTADTCFYKSLKLLNSRLKQKRNIGAQEHEAWIVLNCLLGETNKALEYYNSLKPRKILFSKIIITEDEILHFDRKACLKKWF